MYELKQNLDEMKSIAVTQHPHDSDRPHYWQVIGTDLPFNNLTEFLEFETSLESDESTQNALVCTIFFTYRIRVNYFILYYLNTHLLYNLQKDVFRVATVGSNNYINDVAAIIKKIITKDVQLKYSGCGRKVQEVGKRSFQNTRVFKFMSGMLIMKRKFFLS